MRKIRKRCGCGCGGITNYGKMYVLGHNMLGKKRSEETKAKISEALQGHKLSEETKAKISKSHQGKELSAEHILKTSLANMKNDPNSPYCEIWRDPEYKKDIRKDYCENADCKKISKQLGNHHIHLDKKKCTPNDIMTMCQSCHMVLHRKLQRGIKKAADSKDFIVINRPDHVSYIHKKSHEIIKINKIIKKI